MNKLDRLKSLTIHILRFTLAIPALILIKTISAVMNLWKGTRS